MKLQGLATQLCNTATNLGTELANRNECCVTRAEFYDLVLSPAEQESVKVLEPKLEASARWQSIDVTVAGRTIKFNAQATVEALFFKDCRAAFTAPEALVDRLAVWYDQRVAMGHLAAAFNHYVCELVGLAPTAAHVYRAFPNITTVFARCAAMDSGQIRQATDANPRSVVMLPGYLRGLRDQATQAAVLMELLSEERKRVDRDDLYWLDLPDDRSPLTKVFGAGPYHPPVELAPF